MISCIWPFLTAVLTCHQGIAMSHLLGLKQVEAATVLNIAPRACFWASSLKKKSDYVPIGDDVIPAFAPQLPGCFQRCPSTHGD